MLHPVQTFPHSTRCLLGILVAASLVACGDGREGTDTSGAIGDTLASVGTRAESAAGVVTNEYTDAELLGLLNATNDAEVEIGTLAAGKATDPQVKAFAQRIASEHRMLKTEVDALGRTMSVTPTIPRNDEGIVESRRKVLADLTAKPAGKEFDEAFLEHEISLHRTILDEVSDALDRSPNPQVKALLEKARTGLQGHLTTAQELEKKFGV
jgi:putative membrane protein